MGVLIGQLNVRRSILIEATPARVWQEFTSLERLAAWFGRGHALHVFEPRVSGRVDLSVEIDGQARHFGGAVVVFERERELTFENNWQPPHDWAVPTSITLRLSPCYGGTLVELFHHGFERLAAEAADNLQGYEAGWDSKHLEALRAIVEG